MSISPRDHYYLVSCPIIQTQAFLRQLAKYDLAYSIGRNEQIYVYGATYPLLHRLLHEVLAPPGPPPVGWPEPPTHWFNIIELLPLTEPWAVRYHERKFQRWTGADWLPLKLPKSLQEQLLPYLTDEELPTSGCFCLRGH